MDKDGNLHYSYYYDYRTEHERYSEDENWTGPTHNISHLRGNMDGDSYGEYDNVNFARGVSGELFLSVYDNRILKIVCANGPEPVELSRSEFPVYNKVTGVMDRSDIFHMFLGSYDGSIIEHSIDLNSYTLNKTQTISTGFNTLMGFCSSVSASGDIYLGYLDNYSDIYIYRIPAEEKELIGKLEFYTLDDILVDPTEYLPEKGDTFKVKYILEYDDGSEFTGYNEKKTVKFSLEGTKSGEMPLEFVWYDDSTEMKSVPLEAGSNEIECPFHLNSTSYFGVAGVSAAVYPNETDPEKSSEATAETRKELPEDIDNDNMADRWEREYLEFYDYTDIEQFKPEDDIEKNDKIGAIGDGLTNLSEYMGYWLDGTDYRLEPDELEILYKETMPFPLTSKNYCEEELSLKVIEIPGSSLFKLNDRISAKKTIWPQREDVRTVINDDGILTDSYGDQDGTTKGYMYPSNVGTGGGKFIIYLGTLNNFLGGKEELENQFQQKNLVYKNWVHESFGSKQIKTFRVTYYCYIKDSTVNKLLEYWANVDFSGKDIDGDGKLGWVNIMDILDNSNRQSDDLIFGHDTNWFINRTFLHELGHLFGLGHFIKDSGGKILEEYAVISLNPLSKPSVMFHGLCGHPSIDKLRYSEDERKNIILKN
ncbi:hypothetical protein KAU32_11450 [bacterium]|nr:hypothetical protein [bacterium]